MSNIEIFIPDKNASISLPLFATSVRAGFPSPADDFIDKRLDINEYLIEHPASTFFVKVKGDSMINAGIHSGDILVVDKSLDVVNGKIVIAYIDGEFTVKRFNKVGNKIYLLAENENFHPIEITGVMHFEIWGVVTSVVHKL